MRCLYFVLHSHLANTNGKFHLLTVSAWEVLWLIPAAPDLPSLKRINVHAADLYGIMLEDSISCLKLDYRFHEKIGLRELRV